MFETHNVKIKLLKCGIFEYKPTTSIETGNVFGGSVVDLSVSSCLRRSGVS